MRIFRRKKGKEKIKSIKIRVLLRVLILLIILFVIIDAIFALSFRQESLDEAKVRARTIATIARDSLTSLMVMNVINQRQLFIKRLKKTSKAAHVSSITIIRSQAVDEQFGEGFKDENPVNDHEKYVLSAGKKYQKLVETFTSASYNIIIPYKAKSTGIVDCLACHHVKPGTVLGAINIKMNLTNVRKATLRTVIQTSVIFFIFLAVIVFIFFEFLSPYLNLFNKVELSLESLKEGDMDKALIEEKNLPNDEAGNVAITLNETVRSLKGILQDIDSKVSTLIGYTVVKTDNYLKDTIKIINELVRIYNFKRVIEKDRSKKEIIKRLESIIRDHMSFENYAIYEVKDNNKMEVVAISSKLGLEKEGMWCDISSADDATGCRAKRTGTDVDSGDFPCICPNFIFNVFDGEKVCSEKYNFYCIPVYIGGKVGLILQLIFDDDVKDFVHWMIPYIKGYLMEASPVIESRMLMELLKDQSIVDQLTGLYNRRFLEESSNNIMAGIKRRGTSMGLLMLDLDHFKEVNDKYGHDNGDLVLRSVARQIKKNIREADVAVRFGGEEFLLLLIDIKEGDATEIAEKIRQGVESYPIEIPGGMVLRKTISVGVCEFPKDTDKFWQAVKYADVALYKAKDNGRNRVVRFRPEMWIEEEY